MQTATQKLPDTELITARIGNEWRSADQTTAIIDPYRGDTVAISPVSTQRDCDDAIAAAYRAKDEMAAMPGYERAKMLRRIADNLDARADEIGLAMARESGKAIRDCVHELHRSAGNYRLCAEEAVRIEGEHFPMDATANGAGKLALALRFPVGVVSAITPFNAPINLATHKVGPALAAGNAVVLKSSPKTPLCIHKYVQAIVDAGVPVGAINTVYGDAVGPQMVSDPRVDCVSFTGSIPVGKIIRNSAGMKKVALELGGVGPTFVAPDADLEMVAKSLAENSMALAGQSCVSVQNVYVHKSLYEALVESTVREVGKIRIGDPLDPATQVGTMIDEAAAIRVEGVIERAIAAGAKAVRRGTRNGAQMDGTVLTNVTQDMEAVAQEIFGPALSIIPYEDLDPIFKMISDSPFGLQCGIYTNSLDLAMKTVRSVRTGGIIINGTSRWRSDQMPYGGVKDSGMGREGPKFAIRDMTEERLVVFN
ncbi:aldehyde dehydrogenase family protein [Sphingobium sp.]|uniref:aldehyde dehydrogenase family protein n=1 Tax=Sphingobium sp. TaxID=1912891 RepID=UPI0026142848|nr:aldehyde dehydrogenase family protein [Sphingobium sp.]